MTCRIYCEHGALTAELRESQRLGRIELVYFPYDPDSRTRHIAPTATPSEAQWRDLESISWKELEESGATWADYSGSEHLPRIRAILGSNNRRDALHLDSAYKHKCSAFVTRDTGILDHREPLQQLLGLRFFDPDRDRDELRRFIDSACTT